METKAKLLGVQPNWDNGKFRVMFEIDGESADKLNRMQDKALKLKVTEYKKKRSLDANAYLWLLCTKIAEVVESSKDEVYEEMIQRYGYIDEDEDGPIVITVKAGKSIRRIEGHWKWIHGNGEFNAYVGIKGSSKYNTQEMHHFLQQVIMEAQELGIDTATPDEIARMEALWGERYEKC